MELALEESIQQYAHFVQLVHTKLALAVLILQNVRCV